MSIGAVVANVVAGAVGIASGVKAGLVAAHRWGSPPWRFWVTCVGALVACSALCALGIGLGQRWLAIGALGLLGGMLTGLKYGVRAGAGQEFEGLR